MPNFVMPKIDVVIHSKYKSPLFQTSMTFSRLWIHFAQSLSCRVNVLQSLAPFVPEYISASSENLD